MTELYHVTFYILPFISGMAIGISIGLKVSTKIIYEAIKRLSKYPEYQGKTTQQILEELRMRN